MEWSEYKALCDSPYILSRWMLEQTLELLDGAPELAAAVACVLDGPALPKPADHRGGAATDMFEVALSLRQARSLLAIVDEAVEGDRTTSATRRRGLGGFREAWLEYATYVARTVRDDDPQEKRMSSASSVVKSLIAAFNASDMERIVGHFAPDAVYHNIPVDPVHGTQGIRSVLQGFMGMASKVDWELAHIAETADGVVLTERVDKFLINGKWIALPVMGAFEVASGKITAWRDYFDMNQFQSQLAN